MLQVGVAVIEADPLNRLGLIAALQDDVRLHVCGAGEDARAALAGRERPPAVVLVGGQYYGVSGRSIGSALREIRGHYAVGPIVALAPVLTHVEESRDSLSLDPETILLDAGTPPPQIARTVLRAAVLFAAGEEDEGMGSSSGHWYVGAGIRRLMGRRIPTVGVERFTPREWEVVRLLGHRWEPLEIAEDLGIAYSTVRSHLRSIYAKFGVTSRREAVREASRLVRQLAERSRWTRDEPERSGDEMSSLPADPGVG